MTRISLRENHPINNGMSVVCRGCEAACRGARLLVLRFVSEEITVVRGRYPIAGVGRPPSVSKDMINDHGLAVGRHSEQRAVIFKNGIVALPGARAGLLHPSVSLRPWRGAEVAEVLRIWVISLHGISHGVRYPARAARGERPVNVANPLLNWWRPHLFRLVEKGPSIEKTLTSDGAKLAFAHAAGLSADVPANARLSSSWWRHCTPRLLAS